MAGTTRDLLARWSIDGVDWQRERHSYSGAGYGFTAEVTTGVRAAKPSWTLLVVKEYWHGRGGESLKATRWAQVSTGRRADVVAWLERQARRLETAGASP